MVPCASLPWPMNPLQGSGVSDRSPANPLRGSGVSERSRCGAVPILFNFDCWLRRKGQCRNAAPAKGFLHCTDCKQHMNQRTVVCCATKSAPTLQRQQSELVKGCRPRGIHLNCEAVTALAIAAWDVFCKNCRALRAVWRLQVPGVGRQGRVLQQQNVHAHSKQKSCKEAANTRGHNVPVKLA